MAAHACHRIRGRYPPRKRLAIETDMRNQVQVVHTGTSSMDICVELLQASLSWHLAGEQPGVSGDYSASRILNDVECNMKCSV